MSQYVNPSMFRDEVEEQLNKWANSVSKEYKIHPDTFRITLVNAVPSLFPIVARVTNGAVVQITLVVPWVDKNKTVQDALLSSIKHMKKTIRRLFKYLSNPRVHNDDELFNPLIISDRIHEYVKGESGTHTWKRSTFNPYRIRRTDFRIAVERSMIVTVTHKQTKTSYTVRGSDRPEYDMIREALEKCIESIEINIEEREKEDG